MIYTQSHIIRIQRCARRRRPSQYRLNRFGFTLIELMIVIAIIAILISLAVPRYANYTVRSRISEGLSLAAGAKVAIAEYVMATGNWPENNVSAGLPESISSRYVESITASGNDSNGSLSINFDTSTIPELGSNNLLVLSGSIENGAISWDCRTATNTIANKYLPPECRP